MSEHMDRYNWSMWRGDLMDHVKQHGCEVFGDTLFRGSWQAPAPGAGLTVTGRKVTALCKTLRVPMPVPAG